MTETERLLDQYDRIMNGQAWHGDPVWKILDGILPDQAATRLHANTHTIWELVAHMTFWETVVYRRLNGLPVELREELNFPAMLEPTMDNWNSTLAELRRSNADFRTAVSRLEPARLDQITSAGNKSAYVEVHGVIQHHLYHAGQIAILRRCWEGK
jgi:uncharacterized damage-inducible protein DinB